MVDNNILSDSDRFYATALPISRALKTRYYSVAKVYDPEDIVQRVACKILRQNIQFDESKKKSYESFIFMLVSRAYLDVLRRVRKEENDIYTEDEVSENKTMADYIESPHNKESDIIDSILVDQILDNLPIDGRVGMTPDGIQSLSIRNAVKWKFDGYSPTDIGNWFGVTGAFVGSLIKKARPIIESLGIGPKGIFEYSM